MAYQVLARKWRPKTFSDLVGQQHVVKALRNALDKGRLHHAYLLTGTRGVGKTTIARILAKSLNCEHAQNGEPCGQCSSCTQIDAGRYVDLLEIDAASNTGIDNIREVLENAQYAPTAGKYKVYIIDEVHMLSKSAFNAMLKTLEEPPEHVKFILATTDPHKVPITVLSRCLQFVLRNMTIQQVVEYLAHVLNSENIPFEPAALQLLGRAATGSMRDALSLLDQAIAMGSGSVTEHDVRNMIGAVDTRYLYELLQHIINQDGEALMLKAQEMAARAVGFDNALSELAMLLQRLAMLKTVPSAVAADGPERETLVRLSQYLSDEQIQLYYQCAIHGKHDLNLAPDEYAGFAMTLLRMLAFTPMAAKRHGLDETIEGTQLHNPTPPAAAKKPLSLPETDVTAATAHGQAKVELTAPSAAAPAKTESLTDATAALADDGPASIAAPKPEPTTAILSTAERVDADSIVPPWQTQQPDSRCSHQEAESSLFATKSAHESQTENTEIADESVTLPAENPPLPPINAANWPQIFASLAPQLGAAQMPLQHAAYHSFDENQHLLVLALKDEGRATAKKTYLDRVQTLLTDAYQRPIKLQICDWDSSLNLETSDMRRQRLQAENRQQAQQLLESDSTAQNILNTFQAEWLPESLELTVPEINNRDN